jgi:hypothetical protein
MTARIQLVIEESFEDTVHVPIKEIPTARLDLVGKDGLGWGPQMMDLNYADGIN